MQNFYYMLVGKMPVAVPARYWRLQDESVRRVAATHVGKVYVSTVFLGLNHGLSATPDDPPILFETMAFTDTWQGEYQARYATWDEAERGHATLVRAIEDGGESGLARAIEILRAEQEREERSD